mgnify:CR=1 FL=1
MFHTFQRAEPEKSPEYKKWEDAKENYWRAGRLPLITASQHHESDMKRFGTQKTLKTLFERFKNKIIKLKEKLDTSSCDIIINEIISWLENKSKLEKKSKEFFNKSAKVGFGELTKEDYDDYHTVWKTTLTGISGIYANSKRYKSNSTHIDIQNALEGISNVVRITTSDLIKLDPLKLQKLGDTAADLKAKMVALQKLI